MTAPLEIRDRSIDEATLPLVGRMLVWIVPLGVYAAVFVGVNEWNARRAAGGAPSIDPELPLDAAVPFVPAFVFGYVLYYAWIFLPALLLRRRAHFHQALIAFALVQLPALTIFAVYPTQMTRPAVAGADLAARLVRFLYRLDPGFNILPSVHVAHAVLLALLFYAFGRKHFLWVALGAALICVSTLLIKQHVILDLPAGAALAIVASVSASRLYAYYTRERSTRRS